MCAKTQKQIFSIAVSVFFRGVILACHDYFFDNLDMLFDKESDYSIFGGFGFLSVYGAMRILEIFTMGIARVLYFLLGRDLISDARLWQ